MKFKKPEKNPTEPFKKALSIATKALANEPDLKIVFSSEQSSVDQEIAKVPQISRKMSKEEILVTRGAADSLALKRRFHDKSIYASHLPQGELAKNVYETLEDVRCEILGSKSLPGVATNLDAKIIDDLKKTEFQNLDERNESSIATATGYIFRQLITKRDLPSQASKIAELWRDFIENEAGQTMADARNLLSDQSQFALMSRKIIKDLGYGSQLGDEPNDSNSDKSGANGFL